MRNAPWYASPRSIHAAALVGNRQVAAWAALIAPSRSSRARRSSTRAANGGPNPGDQAQASRSQRSAGRPAPDGAAQREADEGVADHCLIMVLRPMRLQSGMARESQSLAGRRIVVTRAREQAGDLVRALQQLGAEVVTAPTIRIEPLADLAPLGAALADLSRYRWIVFTSRNTVDIVFDRLPSWGFPPPSLGRAAIAAIGPATAAARERYVAEAVIVALARVDELAGARILLPRALEARDALPDGLRARGAVVDVIPVYRTVPVTGDGPALAGEILAGRCDVVTFTSSSTVRHFVDQVGRAAATSGRFATAVIGPVTAATARELGLRVAVEAAEYTVPGLVDALARYYGEGGGGNPKGLPGGRGEG